MTGLHSLCNFHENSHLQRTALVQCEEVNHEGRLADVMNGNVILASSRSNGSLSSRHSSFFSVDL